MMKYCQFKEKNREAREQLKSGETREAAYTYRYTGGQSLTQSKTMTEV